MTSIQAFSSYLASRPSSASPAATADTSSSSFGSLLNQQSARDTSGSQPSSQASPAAVDDAGTTDGSDTNTSTTSSARNSPSGTTGRQDHLADCHHARGKSDRTPASAEAGDQAGPVRGAGGSDTASASGDPHKSGKADSASTLADKLATASDSQSSAGADTPTALATMLQWSITPRRASGRADTPSVQTATASGTAGASIDLQGLQSALQGRQAEGRLATAGRSTETADDAGADAGGTVTGTDVAITPQPTASASASDHAGNFAGLLAAAGQGLQQAATGKTADPADGTGNWDPSALAGPSSTVSTPPSQPAAAASASSIQAEVGSPAFASQLSQNVSLLVKQDIQQARIQVNPQGMGPIDINLNVSGGVVDVSFAVQHPATVHAIQQTLPQLDSLLSSQGLQLGQSQVGHQSGSSQQGFSSPGAAAEGSEDGGRQMTSDSGTLTRSTLATVGLGLIDHFV